MSDETVLIGNLSDNVRYPVTLKHMDNPTERAPMLSEEAFRDEIESWNGSIDDWERSTEQKCYHIARDFYEAKITIGELMPVPKGKIGRILDPSQEHKITCNCGSCRGFLHLLDKCPGCGAQIVK